MHRTTTCLNLDTISWINTNDYVLLLSYTARTRCRQLGLEVCRKCSWRNSAPVEVNGNNGSDVVQCGRLRSSGYQLMFLWMAVQFGGRLMVAEAPQSEACVELEAVSPSGSLDPISQHSRHCQCNVPINIIHTQRTENFYMRLAWIDLCCC